MNNIQPFTKKTRWLSIYFLVIWIYGMLVGACTPKAPTSIAENIPVENQNEATTIAEVQPTNGYKAILRLKRLSNCWTNWSRREMKRLKNEA